MKNLILVYGESTIRPVEVHAGNLINGLHVLCNSDNLNTYRLNHFSNKYYYMVYSLKPGKTTNSVGWSILGLEHAPIYGNVCFVSIAKNGDFIALNQQESEDIKQWIKDECSMWALKASNKHMRAVIDYNKKLINFESADAICRSMRKLEISLNCMDCPGFAFVNDVCYIDAIFDDQGKTLKEISVINQDGTILMSDSLDFTHPVTSECSVASVIELVLNTKHRVVAYDAALIKDLLIKYVDDEEIQEIIKKKVTSCADQFAIVYGSYDSDELCYRRQTLDIAAYFYDIKRIGDIHDSVSNVFVCKEIWETMNKSYSDD